MSGDFAEDRPHETSKSLISILIFFLPGHWGGLGPLGYATVWRPTEIVPRKATAVAETPTNQQIKVVI